jgi:hypothetical protein
MKPIYGYTKDHERHKNKLGSGRLIDNTLAVSHALASALLWAVIWLD